MSERKQVCILQDKARGLGAHISLLNEEKAAVLRSVNNIQSKTKHLPPEVLSQIFLSIRPPIDLSSHDVPHRKYDDDEYPRKSTYRREEFVHFDLAAVSHHWREVVWSTPQLWSSISIGIHKYTVDNGVSCLKLHCENARNVPLTIELDFRDRSAEGLDDLRFLEPVKTALFSHVFPNVQELVLIGFPFEWMLPSTNFELPQCTSLTINRRQCWDDASWKVKKVPISFVGSPHLRCIKLCETFSVIPSCLTVTVLRLDYTTASESLESLASCPNITEFECVDTLDANQSNPRPGYPVPLVLEHVESFSWEGVPRGCPLLHVQFAKLHTLHLRSFNTGEEIVSFFSKLPATLSTLTLGTFFGSVLEVASLLGWVPQLSELCLIDSQPRDFIPTLTGAILDPTKLVEAIPELYRDSFPRLPFLPSLSKLSVSYHTHFILAMMAALSKTRGPSRETFHLMPGSKKYWGNRELYQLKALASAGFDIEVTFKSDGVDSDSISEFRW
jgi:hypothetical protein